MYQKVNVAIFNRSRVKQHSFIIKSLTPQLALHVTVSKPCYIYVSETVMLRPIEGEVEVDLHLLHLLQQLIIGFRGLLTLFMILN